MKEFLLAAVLGCNLYGMDASIPQLTVAPETTLRMAKEFFEFEDQTEIGANAILSAIRCVREGYNSSIANEVKKKILIMEFHRFTRELTPREKQNATELLRIFPFVDEIRVFDLNGYIEGINGSQDFRNYWKTPGVFEGCLDLIKDRICGYNEDGSQNPLFSKLISNLMINSAETNLIYSELLLWYIIYKTRGNLGYLSRSIWNGYEQIQNSPPAILLNRRSYARLNEISISLENFLYTSIFYGKWVKSQNSDGAYIVEDQSSQVIYHEFGHYLGLPFILLYGSEYDKTMETVAPILMNYEFTEETFSVILKGWDDPEVREQSLKMLEELDFKRPATVNKAIEIFKSTKFQTKLLANSAEIFQMYGMFLLKEGGKYTLFMNAYNDLRLDADMGMSIHLTHTGFTPSIVKYNIFPVYGALLEFWGMSLDGYITKTMYPKGLSSLLQMEYQLMNPIWQEHIKSTMSDVISTICLDPEISRINFFQKLFFKFRDSLLSLTDVGPRI